MRHLVTAAALLAVLVLVTIGFRGSEEVGAGTAVRMDLTELARRADLVLEARVLSAKGLENARGLVETEVLLEVARTFLGEDLPLRSVRLPGGVLPDGRGTILAGMPTVRPGQRVLLFLSVESGEGVRVPIGLAQGKCEIVERPDGTRLCVRDAGGLSLVHPATGAVSRSGTLTVLPYAEAVARIEAALAHRKER